MKKKNEYSFIRNSNNNYSQIQLNLVRMIFLILVIDI